MRERRDGGDGVSRQRLGVLLLLFIIVAPLAAQPPGPSPLAPVRGGQTLYQRLGGYDTIAKTVVAFLANLAKDPAVSSMVTGLSEASRLRNRQMITEQLCMLTGGPCVFVGRPNDVSHQGLNIDRGMWDKSQQALAAALDEAGVKDPEKADVIAVVDSLKNDIIQKPKPPAAGRGRSGR
jgi:hemoglobin